MDSDDLDTISIDTLALEEQIQEDRSKELSQLHSLSKDVDNLHTSIMYYRNPNSHVGLACHETWKIFVKKVGGSLGCWRELGHHLGISHDDLNYIENCIKDDPTDMVLKKFMENENKNATIDKILDALCTMKRYDILKALEFSLRSVEQFFNKADSKSDAGYHSDSKNGPKEIITFIDNLPNDLPLVLRNSLTYTAKDTDSCKYSGGILSEEPSTVENDIPTLLLTFTEDGLETALNIKEKARYWPDEIPINILILNDHREKMLQCPEKYIRQQFEKAAFVVPILTEGYMNAIRSNNVILPSTNDNLDCKYANFIYNLIITQYIHFSACSNYNVRSILPANSNPSFVYKNISSYPDLMPWTPEKSFDKQFQEFLKSL